MQSESNTLRPGDSPSMCPTQSMIKTLELLQKAIAYGHVEKAKELVANLAEQKALLSVTEQPEKQTTAFEEDIKVRVYVEDKDLSGSSILMKMKPSMTIGQLKRMMLEKHEFPPEIQKWIVGRRLVNNEETLQKLHIKNGSSMFLYLLSPKSVGLTKEEYMRKYHHRFQDQQSVEGEYMQMGGVRVPRQSSSGESSGGPTPSPRTPQIHPLGAEPRRATDVPFREMPPVREGAEDAEYAEMQPMSMPSMQAPPLPPLREPVQLTALEVGWKCPLCTFKNEPTRPGCEMCSADRPKDYQVPKEYKPSEREKRRMEEEQRAETMAKQELEQVQQQEQLLAQQNYSLLLESLNHPLATNDEEFDCAICFDTVPPGSGVILRECLHQFCRTCVSAHILVNEEACVKCPYQDEKFSCQAVLLDSEIKALVSPAEFEKYLLRSLVQAESLASNSYHCKTPDCAGWCVYDDDANFFQCPVCHKSNCLTCKAIHEGQDCKEYQTDLKIKAQNDEAAKQTQKALQEMLRSGDGMECPQCKVIITKKVGCDWLRCTMCRTEICWVTKGPRWGPKGTGDTSGGCKCNVKGKRCHPRCQNCH